MNEFVQANPLPFVALFAFTFPLVVFSTIIWYSLRRKRGD